MDREVETLDTGLAGAESARSPDSILRSTDGDVRGAGRLEEESRMSSPADLEELGRRIRKLRVDRRMTLKQVELACGLSATHLSEIERGRTSPTIGALVRIARSLGRLPSFFLEHDELADVALVHGDQARSWAASPGVTVHVLSPGIPGTELFTYRLTFRGSASDWRLAAHGAPGDALYFVVRGAVEARLGDLTVHLAEGDAVQGRADVAHRLKNSSGEPAEVLATLTRSIEKHH